MKSLIKKLLREAINLNLTKELSKDWKKQRLNDIFGENIYRIYYDLDTGKQITPTKKNPKLNFDVPITDKLKTQIIKLIGNHNFEVLNFENNEAINKTNNQKSKLSKVLNWLDKDLFNKYTLFLDSSNRNISSDKKLFAMVSRHPHDISTMGSYDKTQSCADMKDYTKKKDIVYGEGTAIILQAIKDGDIIMYLIEDGDWNKQRPIARYLMGDLCGYEVDAPTWMYGDFNQKFANFIEDWVATYNVNVHNQQGFIEDDKVFEMSVYGIVNIIRSVEPSSGNIKARNNRYSFLLRGLITNKRYDVLYEYIKIIGSNRFFNLSSNVYGDDIYKNLPENIKNLLTTDSTELFKYLDEIIRAYNGETKNIGVIGHFLKDTSLLEAISMFVQATDIVESLNFYYSKTNQRYNKLFNNDSFNKLNSLKPILKKIMTEIGYANLEW